MYGRAMTDGLVACSTGHEYGRRRHLRESAPELAAPRGRAPLCWPRRRGALPLCWPRRRGACPWAGRATPRLGIGMGTNKLSRRGSMSRAVMLFGCRRRVISRCRTMKELCTWRVSGWGEHEQLGVPGVHPIFFPTIGLACCVRHQILELGDPPAPSPPPACHHTASSLCCFSALSL